MNNSMSSLGSDGTTPGQSVWEGEGGYIHLVVVVVIVLSYNIFFTWKEGKEGKWGAYFLREPDFFVNSFFFFLRLDESSTSLCSCFFLPFSFHACPLAPPPAAPPSSPSSSRTLKRQPTFSHKVKTVKFKFKTWWRIPRCPCPSPRAGAGRGARGAGCSSPGPGRSCAGWGGKRIRIII